MKKDKKNWLLGLAVFVVALADFITPWIVNVAQERKKSLSGTSKQTGVEEGFCV